MRPSSPVHESRKGRALVVGCSSGIGRASALALSAAGYDVVAAARRLDTLRELPVSQRLAIDVTSQDSVGRAVEAAGAIDVLINSAGFGLQGPVERVPLEKVYELFETNFFGTARLLQAVVPGMRERQRGTIVIVSSVGGRQARPFTGFYAASKAAVELLAEGLSYEVEPYGVRVLIVEPGAVATRFQESRVMVAMDEPPYDEISRQWQRSMGNRVNALTTSEEVANAILRALENPSQPFRTPVGADAIQILGLRDRLSDEEYREYVWATLRGAPIDHALSESKPGS